MEQLRLFMEHINCTTVTNRRVVEMNHSDRNFVIILLGSGLGLGVALAQKNGIVGFFVGFGVSVIAFILILSTIRFLAWFMGRFRQAEKSAMLSRREK